ncbi:hypothetical protein [Mesorhizobium xinjiangense]|uniref:hypothetical protein n=1 Tax=Mesorhizobium xinjiangense TaxID=2678685 RepID=UPI0012ED1C94|nr:hypothetical protein [Mesorhizobium xinjiangense]
MKRLMRIAAFLVLATFAAATFAQAVATTDMSLRMAAATKDHTGGCDGCDETRDAAIACDQICAVPLAVLPASESTETDFAEFSPGQSISRGLLGRSSPPERHPPR